MIELLALSVFFVILHNISLQRQLKKLKEQVETDTSNIGQLWSVVQPEDSKFLGRDGEITCDIPTWLDKAA